jgi:Xaa-Pro aminopeptidase
MAATLLATLPCFAAAEIPVEEYARRRADYARANADGITVIFGRTLQHAEETRAGFFQEANFLYLTGLRVPGAILLIVPGGKPEEILFLPKFNEKRAMWDGRYAAADDKNIERTIGAAKVLPVEAFEAALLKALEQKEKLYTLTSTPEAERLQKLAPLRTPENAAPAVAKLRMTKSKAEQAVMAHALDATMQAHLASWTHLREGMREYEISAVMTERLMRMGCERHAYAPIVGSGPNANVLHYTFNNRRMEDGELLLMDVGGEYHGYAADLTRTVPVNGRFTKRQREIYDAVLHALEEARKAARPGMSLQRTGANSLFRIAKETLDRYPLGPGGKPLGEFMPHGLGHHVGLEVHDANDAQAALAPGHIVTLEPGVYLPEEGLGIRIEDMILITEDGNEVLSQRLPRKAEEVEKFFRLREALKK